MKKFIDTSFASAKAELNEKEFIGEDILIYDDMKKTPVPDGPRRMSFIMVALCTGGSAHYTIDTEEKTMNKNDITIIPEGHVLENMSRDKEMQGLCMIMSTNFFYEMVRCVSDISSVIIFSKTHPVVSLTEHEAQVYTTYFQLLKAKIAETGHPFRRKLVQALVLTMFYDLSGVLHRMQAISDERRPRAETIFTRFMKLVEANFRNERRVSWYAEQMHITPKYLAETVKQVSQRTPNEWIDNYVTLEIRLLLKNSSKSIKDISEEMNFPNQSFLGKFFKEHVGISPSAYRRTHSRLK